MALVAAIVVLIIIYFLLKKFIDRKTFRNISFLFKILIVLFVLIALLSYNR